MNQSLLKEKWMDKKEEIKDIQQKRPKKVLRNVTLIGALATIASAIVSATTGVNLPAEALRVVFSLTSSGSV